MKSAKDLLLQLDIESDPIKRVDIIVLLTEHFLNNDLTRCETYANQLLEIGEENDLPIAYMHYNLVMGRLSYRKADLKGSFAYYTKANNYAAQLEDKAAQAIVLESKAVVLHKWGQNDEALVGMFAALDTYKVENVDKGLIGMCYNGIANTYDSMKQTKEAKEYYLLAIETLENSDKKQIIDFVKANLGLMLLNQKEFSEAIEYFNNSLKGFLAANQVQAQGLTYHYLGQCYMGLNQHSKSLELYHKGLKLFKHSRYYNELSIIYMGLGTLYQDLGGFSNTEVYFNKALDMRLIRGFWHGACQCYEALFNLYIVMGDRRVAGDMLQSGLILAKEHKLLTWINDFEKLAKDFKESET